MTRADFTNKLAQLLGKMISDGESPIIDYVKRGAIEQKRLFDRGLSKCDGVKKLSKHQTGKAADIYFMVDGNIDFGYSTQRAKDNAKKYHDYWVSIGGNPVISWDLPHYEII